MKSSKVNTIFFNFLRGFAPPVFNFLLALLGYAYYGAKNWGTFVGLLLLLFLFNFIANFGNREYLIRKFSKEPQRISSHFASNFITRFPLLTFSLLLLFYYDYQTAALAIAVILFRYIHNSFDSLIIYQQRFRLQFITELIGFITVAAIIFYNETFSLNLVLTGYLMSSVLKSLLLYFALKLSLKKHYFIFDRSILIQLLPFFLISLSGWMHSRIDLYLVDYFLAEELLSSYQILVSAFLLLDTVSSLMVQPFTKHIYRLNPLSIIKMRKLLLVFCLPIVLAGSFAIFYLLENFTAAHFSNTVYLWMLLGAIPPFFYMVDIYLMFRNKRERTIMKVSFAGAAINIIIGLIFIPIYDIVGAAVAVCVSKWVMMVIPFLVKKAGYLTSN